MTDLKTSVLHIELPATESGSSRKALYVKAAQRAGMKLDAWARAQLDGAANIRDSDDKQ